ncbi:MAG: flagellar motor protein PomA [Xanthomonadales bacterium]|nr:flagellar motor protein PomA [Xanthomonadales bacterium]
MDLATLLGILGAFGIITAAVITGGNALGFLNLPSILIVVGGTSLVVLSRVTLAQFLGAFKVAMKAFLHKGQAPEELIHEAVTLAKIVRKDGILAIEDKPISHPFFAKGINMCIDGQDTDVIKHCLANDINLTIQHQSAGADMFSATGDVAPAMGMIGTLIGLVQMLSSMEDPKSIGPAMAVALLTTLYGAILANAFALPIAAKLKLRSREESLNKKLILESISGIQSGTHPKVLEQMLINYLPQEQRDTYASVD